MVILQDHLDVPSRTDWLTAFICPAWLFGSTLNTFLWRFKMAQVRRRYSRKGSAWREREKEEREREKEEDNSQRID